MKTNQQHSQLASGLAKWVFDIRFFVCLFFAVARHEDSTQGYNNDPTVWKYFSIYSFCGCGHIDAKNK